MTKTEQVYQWIRSRICAQQFIAGSRVPSIRGLATKLGYSPFTVSQAYDRLVAEGMLQARGGSGFYVCHPPAPLRINDGAHDEMSANVLDSGWLMRHLFHGFSAERAPGSGLLPKSWLLQDDLSKFIRQAGEYSAQFSYEYGRLQGYPTLRAQNARQMDALGIVAQPEQIVTTHGASSGVDSVVRCLTRRGEAVVVDEPCWFWLIANLQQQGLNVIGVARDGDGPDIAALEHAFKNRGARLYISNSVLHNPTSANLHPARAHQVINLLHQYDAWLLEDDIYAAFAPHALRYATLDQLERVFYVSGVSKVLGGNWRVGYIAAPQTHVERILRQKMLSNMTCSELNERIVCALYQDGSYRKHLAQLRQRLNSAHARIAERLHNSHLHLPNRQQAGLFIWLDTGINSTELALRAADEQWLIAPGQLFSASAEASTHIRLNVATTSDAFLDWLCVHTL